MKKQNHYTLLGLAHHASAEEIRQAYFEAARRLHPDKNIAPGETELFLDIQEAYEVLSNPDKRSKYDVLLPPESPSDTPLVQNIILSRRNLLNFKEPQLVYAILEFSAPANLKATPASSLNLCLVLDRSTSMQGKNMDVVKNTAIHISRKLNPQDVFSVVAFSDRAETIIPATNSPELNKQEARIQMLQPSGGTEIFAGLEMGYNQIIRNASHFGVNHIILITDGHTYGDETKCLQLAQQASEQNIGISGLGIGSEWNDNFLDELASRTGGSSMFVPKPHDIQSALLNKLARLGRNYIEEARLEFESSPGIQLRYAFRLQPEAGLLSFESPILMGPIGRETKMQVLIELVIQPEVIENGGTISVLKGKTLVTFADPASAALTIPVHINCSVTDEPDADPPPVEIVEALSRLKLYRLQEQARLEVTAGNFDQAADHLARLATHLLAQGERGLARTALMEAENIQQKKSFSQLGRKEIKYGTRALLSAGRSSEKL